MRGNTKPVDVLGVPVSPVTTEQVLDIVDDSIESRKPLNIGVVNAAKIVNMRRDVELRNSVLSSDIILADGIAVVLASKLLGGDLPERVTGIDLMYGMLKRGNIKGYRVYCLGATQEVSDKVAAKISELYPNVVMAGRNDGYFDEHQEKDVAESIAEARPDILFVAITSPKKENFMARWSEIMNVPVVHGVGGSFDVMAGKVERAPAVWQKLGLEWLYRVKQEPGRLWKRYLVTNSLFCWITFKALIMKFIPTFSSR